MELESYWNGWWRARRKATGPLTEEEARRWHEAGEEYCVVLSNGSRPVVVLTFHLKMDNYIEVQFLDEDLWPRYAYIFSSPDDRARAGQVFLGQFFDSEHDEQGNVERMTHVRFWPDGRMYMTRKDEDGTVEEGWSKEPQSAEELERHWEPIPDFGEWDSIMRFDRKLTALS